MANNRLILAGCAAAAALLAACSEAPPQPSEPASAPVAAAPAAPTPAPADGETVGGDGSPIVLEPLALADLQGAQLGGELGCSFRTPEDALLLTAMGFVAATEAARGVVKVSGYVEPVAAPGGFDGMVNGATFTGQGKTVVIAVTGPATGGGESPPYPATLTYQRADGASRVIPGQWTCGP